ncbi:MAG TPA: hypothetical protein VMO47_15420, partial [Rhodothermales bacterium]|nr:hypothetical protein [Rhodothermales bacterium]
MLQVFMRYASAALLLSLGYSSTMGQSFTESERLEGYALRSDTTIFVFDPKIYDVEPSLVSVTGSFRGWDPTMEDRAWQLSQTDGVWSLMVPNTDHATIRPHSQFKYRIDEGAWIDPPPNAPNRSNGNLIFLKGVLPPALHAEIQKPTTIWAIFTGTNPPLNKSAYRLTDAYGG